VDPGRRPGRIRRVTAGVPGAAGVPGVPGVPGRMAGPLLAASLVAVPLTVSIVLNLQRLTVTSDSVAQQSVVRTWLRAGHGQTYLPPDTWLLKLPLYLVVEVLPLAPPARLLAESAALALLAFALLAAGMRALILFALPPGAAVNPLDVALPLAWLGTLGGGLGQYLAVMPNSRNIELGLSFCLLAVLGHTLRDSAAPRRRWITATAAAAAVAALSLLWADDPYEAYLAGAPLAAACLAWFVLRRRDWRLPGAAAVLAASLLALPLWRRALAAAGVQVVPDATGVTLSPARIAAHLPLIWPSLAAQTGLRGPVPAAGAPARVTVLVVLAAAVPAAAWLAVRGWHTRNLPLAFLGAHWPVVVAGVLVNRTIYDFHAGRYLVLGVFDLAVCAGVAVALLRPARPRLAAGAAALLAAAVAANLIAVVLDDTRRPALAVRQDQTLAVLERTGAVKGYSGFWAADLYTHSSGGRIMVSDVACSAGRLRPRHWLTDSARITIPARRTFVLWDPSAPDQAGCSLAALVAQFGDPAQRIPAPAGGVILLYQDDVTGRLAGPGTGP
jgi:hypothetical protein